MKLSIALIISVFLLASCKDKLPSNIKSQVEYTKIYTKGVNEVDNRIVSLTNKDIENMSLDTLISIFSSRWYNYNQWSKQKDVLDDLLKYNAKYSDYDEVQNIYPNFLSSKEFRMKVIDRAKVVREIKGIKDMSLEQIDFSVDTLIHTDFDLKKEVLDNHLRRIVP